MSRVSYRGIRARPLPPLLCLRRRAAPAFPMGLTGITGYHLRHMVYAHPKTVAMFTARGCPHCEHLLPVVETLPTNAAYEGIAFVLLDAGQNAVAQQLLARHGGPFFVTYCRGRLLHCETLYTESQVRALLHTLLAHS